MQLHKCLTHVTLYTFFFTFTIASISSAVPSASISSAVPSASISSAVPSATVSTAVPPATISAGPSDITKLNSSTASKYISETTKIPPTLLVLLFVIL
ncbi:uncharacterized protein LOC124807760 isoform X4 [Hydra vulgaris]|uniref:uncharacterized protein LOC124806505 isoform X4 n=1 Tax=Hydra vulgaris TaxID=6087 RepID=UPI0032E9DC18